MTYGLLHTPLARVMLALFKVLVALDAPCLPISTFNSERQSRGLVAHPRVS